jgi:hypothetical protein
MPNDWGRRARATASAQSGEIAVVRTDSRPEAGRGRTHSGLARMSELDVTHSRNEPCRVAIVACTLEDARAFQPIRILQRAAAGHGCGDAKLAQRILADVSRVILRGFRRLGEPPLRRRCPWRRAE